MKRIKYIGYYDFLESEVSRSYALSAVNKMNYIISVLNKNNIGVDVVSFSRCNEKKFLIDKGFDGRMGDMNTLKISPAISGNRVSLLLSRYFQYLLFFFWFIRNVRNGEEIILYHSLGYSHLFNILKKFKRFSIIGEIEEIYQDVTKKSQSTSRNEYKFINNCDKFIFPTQLLDEKLNVNKKPSVIIHGLYSVEKRRNATFGDDKIHVIYAGTFDQNKGGAAAAAAAAYLPNNYHVHICGFGNRKDEEIIKEIIAETTKKRKAKVTFDGLLKGEDFIQMLQKCTIGLSTQDPNAAFNGTSFPSKVLTYLSNGLKVVSIRIPAIEKSYVGSTLIFYDDQTPENIATAIISATNKVGESSERLLSTLDERFGLDIVYLLN